MGGGEMLNREKLTRERVDVGRHTSQKGPQQPEGRCVGMGVVAGVRATQDHSVTLDLLPGAELITGARTTKTRLNGLV